MTLKNSFLADGQEKDINTKKVQNGFFTDVKENMKRRNWVFWISFLLFLCYFPGYLVLALNNLRSTYAGRDAEGILRMQERMTNVVESVFCLNGLMPVFIIGISVLIGMQGFVYLHNKRQVDFYHSQPVSRKRRFRVLWFNGIVIFAAAYLINMVLGMAVAAAFGCMSSAVIMGAIKAFLLYLLLFLGIYHISIIAVLLTGNTLVSLLAMIVLLGYELAIRALMVVMASSFFLTYGNGGEEEIFDTLASPIVTIYKYIILGGEYDYWQYADKNYTYGNTSLVLVCMAIVFGGISYFLYKNRVSESHGNSISFPKIKEVVRFALLLAVGGFGTYFIYYVAGENVTIGIAGAVFFVALGHAVIQLIYEVDFRAIRRKWPTAIVSLAVVVLAFFGYRYDWTGYDRRVPKQSKVESVYLSLIAEGFGDNNYVMPDGTEIYRHSYEHGKMKITDLDTVYELLEQRENIHRDTTDFYGTYNTIEFVFHLKNGKTEHRRIYFHYEENMDLLDKIYHMEEYQLANNQVMEDNFVENYRIISALYHDGLREKELTGIDLEALVEAYKKDVENASYAEVYYNIPLAKISLLGIGLQSDEYRNQWDILVYDSYKNTRALLEKAGITRGVIYDEAYFNTIKKIEVRFDDDTRLETGEALTWEECHKSAIYNTEEMYEKILKDAVPGTNRWWGSNSNYNSNGYMVYVYTMNPYDENDYYCDEVYFKDGKIPQFLVDDLKKIPYGEERIIGKEQ